MISVVVYGRNDSHGYNLPKRAAISLNCIAEILTDPHDEILFVDCNTPDDMPTFPEAIADTLTRKAKELIRVFRIRPALFDKYKKGSPLKVLESLSRNVAVRRSNPLNRWILSTNPDMIFVMRQHENSLSDTVKALSDGYYALPRFELPVTIWEGLDRQRPGDTIDKLRKWSRSLHLNEVVYGNPVVTFDAPGDFQLMLRDQLFAINGFNESMVMGWHVDSNLCKRLYLLNGETRSFLDYCFGYHCIHTRQAGFGHSSQRTENDLDTFFEKVKDSCLSDQMDWGLSGIDVEEIHLTDSRGKHFVQVLEALLPGMVEPYTSASYSCGSYNHNLLYDEFHSFPFLVDYFTCLPRGSKIAYFGGNLSLAALLRDFVQQSRFGGELLLAAEPLDVSDGALPLSSSHVLPTLSSQECMANADLFIFDFSLASLRTIVIKQGLFPNFTREAREWFCSLLRQFFLCARTELERPESPRRFLCLGTRHSFLETIMDSVLDYAVAPYAVHVIDGYVRKNANLGSVKRYVRALLWPSTEKIIEAVDFVLEWVDSEEPLLVCDESADCLEEPQAFRYTHPVEWTKGFRWAIFCRSDFYLGYKDTLARIGETMRPVFANSEYVCYTGDPRVQVVPSKHLLSWRWREFRRLVRSSLITLKILPVIRRFRTGFRAGNLLLGSIWNREDGRCV